MKQTTSAVDGQQPGVAGRPEAALRDVDDLRAPGTGDVGGPVGRAVVGHDRAVATRHPVEDPGQRRRLVEARQHDVDRHPARPGP
jgi:hypothetical protein